MTRFPAGVLAGRARRVEEIGDDIVKLVDVMVDIMLENKGIGLAAPQAGVDLRLFVISLDGSREGVQVFINPEIEVSGDIDSVEEGCLSLPGVYGKIKRYTLCKVTATALDGKEFCDVAEGLYARALQHEYDHLEGTLIKDKFGRLQMIGARKHLKKLLDESE
ncbi:MAG: peptide deformylase [Planctomycetes bacterium]|nr:peptide deformylase [Planctomycetota bacterium]